MGAPTWPPYPQRSERPGAAVALLDPPAFGAPRRSRGAPRSPNVRSAPAQPWRSSIPGVRQPRGRPPGEDPVMSRSALIGGGQTLVGFILSRGLATRPLAQIRAIYADLGDQIIK